MLLLMPSSDEPQAPITRGTSTARPRIRPWQAFGSVLPSAVGVWAVVQYGSPEVQLIATALLAISIALFAIPVSALFANKSAIEASRVRVREAERDLENAVRLHAHTIVVGNDGPPVTTPSSNNTPIGHYGNPYASQAESHRLTLAEQWKLTHARLDLYHQVALGQAKNLSGMPRSQWG